MWIDRNLEELMIDAYKDHDTCELEKLETESGFSLADVFLQVAVRKLRLDLTSLTVYGYEEIDVDMIHWAAGLIKQIEDYAHHKRMKRKMAEEVARMKLGLNKSGG